MKKERRSQPMAQGRRAVFKRMALLSMLLLAAIVLSSCIVEPDRIVDDNGLSVGQGGQQEFDTVLTPTPEATATPTVAPDTGTQGNSWDVDWNFGVTNEPNQGTQDNVGATNPPDTMDGTNTGGDFTVTTPTPNAAASYETLRDGSSGTAVEQLQQRLKELGYYNGSVDGKYGAGTVSAVKAFQSGNSLSADGIAGNSTQRKLYDSSAIPRSQVTVTATPKPASSGSSSSSSSSSSTSYSKPSGARTDIYLRLGSNGTQVKYLQNRLISLGYLTGTADGDFETTTELAVIAFQKRNNEYGDGVAGPNTLTKLYSSSAKKASEVVANIGSLREGMSGSGVRSLQEQLKTLGYYTGKVDGSYGSGTKAAVIAFQSAHNLTPDGVAGKATLAAIYGSTGGNTGGNTGGSSSSNPKTYGAKASSTGYTTISASSSSVNITQLQTVLQSKNYYSGSLDGSYGTGTQAAVESFQRAMNLRVTGTAGPTTQRLLYGTTAATGNYNKLDVGSTGSAVQSLQYALYELRYYDGNITGTYDETTKNAVMLFQQVNGLAMDGVAGQDTQRQLFSSVAIGMNLDM